MESLDSSGIGQNPEPDKAVSDLETRRLRVEGMTCGNCVNHVERSLRALPGLQRAKVDFRSGELEVIYNPLLVDLTAMRFAIRDEGYDLADDLLSSNPATGTFLKPRPGQAAPVLVGLVAGILLIALYVVTVGLVQDFNHAIDLVAKDWYYVVPISLGFGLQIDLFVYWRRILKGVRGTRSSKLLTGTGTGASTVSMVACCAHHLTDVLPIVGLAGATVFLNDYRAPIMVGGILINAASVVLMIHKIRRLRKRPLACTQDVHPTTALSI